MDPQSIALVESVAKALVWAINDPQGRSTWNDSLGLKVDSPSGGRRGVLETQQAATVFDSSVIPPISIHKYLARLRASFRCSDATFLAALILVDRMLECDGSRLPLTMHNVHRLFLACLVVSVKYHEDIVFANSHYAKAGGVALKEVNRLERTLLKSLDFDLGIDPDQFQRFEAALLSLCPSEPGAGTSGPVGPILPGTDSDIVQKPDSPPTDEAAAAPVIVVPSCLAVQPGKELHTLPRYLGGQASGVPAEGTKARACDPRPGQAPRRGKAPRTGTSTPQPPILSQEGGPAWSSSGGERVTHFSYPRPPA